MFGFVLFASLIGLGLSEEVSPARLFVYKVIEHSFFFVFSLASHLLSKISPPQLIQSSKERIFSSIIMFTILVAGIYCPTLSPVPHHPINFLELLATLS
jgi:hypothetical protein